MSAVSSRPEIIRLARVFAALDEHCDHILVHTGHYCIANVSENVVKIIHSYTGFLSRRNLEKLPNECIDICFCVLEQPAPAL
jgi:UDP-N-acetylglucosamine 2-epimerase